jgi:hypothetical protein
MATYGEVLMATDTPVDRRHRASPASIAAFALAACPAAWRSR